MLGKASGDAPGLMKLPNSGTSRRAKSGRTAGPGVRAAAARQGAPSWSFPAAFERGLNVATARTTSTPPSPASRVDCREAVERGPRSLREAVAGDGPLRWLLRMMNPLPRVGRTRVPFGPSPGWATLRTGDSMGVLSKRRSARSEAIRAGERPSRRGPRARGNPVDPPGVARNVERCRVWRRPGGGHVCGDGPRVQPCPRRRVRETACASARTQDRDGGFAARRARRCPGPLPSTTHPRRQRATTAFATHPVTTAPVAAVGLPLVASPRRLARGGRGRHRAGVGLRGAELPDRAIPLATTASTPSATHVRAQSSTRSQGQAHCSGVP